MTLEAWRRTLADCGSPHDSLAARAAGYHRRLIRDSFRLFDDAGAFIEGARAARLPLVLVTNGASDTQREKLEVLGITGWFDAIVISGEVGTAKPDPSVFLLALERLGLEAESTWHVGDACPRCCRLCEGRPDFSLAESKKEPSSPDGPTAPRRSILALGSDILGEAMSMSLGRLPHKQELCRPHFEVGSPWSPIAPVEIAELLADTVFFWCLAGGHAVDRFVGEAFREHADTDIVVLRPDQLELQERLQGWKLFAADPPGSLRPWSGGEFLLPGVDNVWGHRVGRNRWELDVMIQESEGGSWVFRRDQRIRGPVDDLASPLGGIPCIRMDLQMLYKSKGRRPKDELDFERVLPKLTQAQRATLAAWLNTTNSGGHEWATRLAT